jgi:hypothetical protein
MHTVISQDVTYILAKVTLNTLAELLDAVDIRLLHSPGSVRRIRLARLELLDALLYFVVPGHIADQVFDSRERLQRLNGDWLVQWKLA